MSGQGLVSATFGLLKGLPRRLFGTRNDRLLKTFRRQVEPIGEWEAQVRGDYDERLAARVAAEGLDKPTDEEGEARLQQIRVELSDDLRARSKQLSERMCTLMEVAEAWWNGLKPTDQLEEHYRNEYRKRVDRVIEVADQEGVTSEAFAVLREASRRAQNHRHFDCQLIGGRVLFEGKIAEMRTGEGKTIVCHLAAYLKVLSNKHVHIVTVNDYLVQRDAEFARPIFELLGISVGYIQSQIDPGGREGLRRQAYGSDICYGTNSEFGFDYLRDNMKTSAPEQVQGPLHFVIVDEVDSILIDEARTPLIISGPARDDVSRYPRARHVAQELVRKQNVWDRRVMNTVAKFDGNAQNIQKLEDAMSVLGYREHRSDGGASGGPDAEGEADALPTLGPDFLTDDHVEAIQIYEAEVLNMPASERYRRYFIVQTERKQVGITHEGVTIAQEILDIGSLYSGDNMEWPHLIENALRAEKVYQRDRDYVVQEGQVIIVDPFTGRLMHGRQWSDGLHQACEAKENVRVKEETQTLATITIQNFVKLYQVKAGMTGTAATEATEFDKIYRLEVIEIPTNRPVNRVDHNDKMYRDEEQKYGAIVDEIHEVHRRGRPADPFMLHDALAALRPIVERKGGDVARIDEAIRQFNHAELGDKVVIRFMLETYDEAMGDLVRGRPILVGTTSVENSEKLSRLLDRRYGIEHEVLNAKNHAREADIVAKAGHCTIPTQGNDKTPRGNVTIATNMAGRGTDIKLAEGVVYPTCKVPDVLPEGVEPSALYPTGVSKCCVACEEYDPETNCAHCFKPKLDDRFPDMGRNVCPINVPCGLHIIGTERHEARRIDNQLRGRAGRQGDPGSSRFSLSLQDDLLRLFMADWMLRMLDRFGFADGATLEDKRLTKGIERAQRKVEERNFTVRKSLLEWDEPMDFQRKEFYAARQRILEERDLPELIFGTIEEAIQAMLEQFLGGNYDRMCVAEWCRAKLGVTIEEDSIETGDADQAQASVRDQVRSELHDQIRTSIGEYVDAEEPPNKWDLSGLLHWAGRLFKVPHSQNHLRKMAPADIEQALLEAADEHVDSIEMDGLDPLLEPEFPYRALADWGRSKFGIEMTAEEIIGKSRGEIEALVQERVREAYHRREVSYPVESCLERAFAEEGTDHAMAAEMVVAWANAKFDVGWTLADVQGHPIPEIQSRLLQLNESYFDGKLEEEIDTHIAGKDREVAIDWAMKRFGGAWNQARFDRFEGALRDALVDQGREMLRWELTRLEHYVLLRIHDQAWKDHLLEMDHLKQAISQRPLGGDQTHPQSQFAIEGRDLFRQMWERIAGRVTDVIFKVRMQAPAGANATSTSSGAAVSYGHADATGAGFAGYTRDQAAAMRAQNVEQKVETIRRDKPRVKRNDPCPCGSGKKYKSCHGKGE